MTYDDERVIALLKESVPAVPEVPTRVDSVRRIAARQRTAAVVRGVAAAASLLVVAVSLVLLRPGAASEVKPVRDPIPTMVRHFRSGTVRVEASMGRPEDLRRIRAAYRLDGSRMQEFRNGTETRIVDRTVYERAEDAAPGTPWTRYTSRAPRPQPSLVASLEEWMPYVSDVRYAGQGKSRGVRVAEYTATMASEIVGMPDSPLSVRFGVDSKGRLRRFEARFTDGYGYSFELYDWGKPVDVEAPPASEVVDQ